LSIAPPYTAETQAKDRSSPPTHVKTFFILSLLEVQRSCDSKVIM
jgi:hypothetical protein